LGDATITAEKSKQVVGAVDGRKVTRYVSMAPAGWSIENQDPRAGVSFIQIEGAEASPFDQNGGRPSRAGELILAHRVTNIAEIALRAEALGAPIVAPLGPSGSGKSTSMAILDPNGVRIEMYEY
jgi:catechol 2,3-dioxygenase-like lactoylglutathione lyase family enzyme